MFGTRSVILSPPWSFFFAWGPVLPITRHFLGSSACPYPFIHFYMVEGLGALLSSRSTSSWVIPLYLMALNMCANGSQPRPHPSILDTQHWTDLLFILEQSLWEGKQNMSCENPNLHRVCSFEASTPAITLNAMLFSSIFTSQWLKETAISPHGTAHASHFTGYRHLTSYAFYWLITHIVNFRTGMKGIPEGQGIYMPNFYMWLVPPIQAPTNWVLYEIDKQINKWMILTWKEKMTSHCLLFVCIFDVSTTKR